MGALSHFVEIPKWWGGGGGGMGHKFLINMKNPGRLIGEGGTK